MFRMTILSNCHTHTQFCDGRSTAEEMVLSAIENKFVSLGFSTHGPQMYDPDYCVIPEEEQAYKDEILRLREKYQDKIRIWLGIERDLFSCADPRGYDYYLASVHYIPTTDGYMSVDGNADILAEGIKKYLNGDGLMFAQRYFELLSGYARAYHPPIIGHFDLVRKNNTRLHFADEESTAYKDMVVSTLSAIRKTGAMLEVNTGAIGRGYMQSVYPSDFALKEWLKLGGEVIVSSDCHDAKYIACAFDEMPGLLRKIGYDHVVRLGSGKDLFDRVAL